MNDYIRAAADDAATQLFEFLRGIAYPGTGDIAPGLDREFRSRFGAVLCSQGFGYDGYSRIVEQLALLDGLRLPGTGKYFYLPPFVSRLPTPKEYNDLRTIGRCGTPGQSVAIPLAGAPASMSLGTAVLLLGGAAALGLYLARKRT